MDLTILQVTWFVLVGVLLAGYAILDGFDLGVGILHMLLPRGDEQRRIYINAIAPVWDGNEVWLLTGGGAIFAAFPPVYATVFSGFYIALMLLLAALIFRAVAIEFRSKVESAGWRKTWDFAFFLGSLLPAILLGVALGNVLRGVPLTADREFDGTFLGLLNPYAVLVGLLSLAMCTLHGSVYLATKTEAEMRQRVVSWIPGLWALFLILFIFATAATWYVSPFLFTGLMMQPTFWIIPILLVAAAVVLIRSMRKDHYATAFAASSVMVGCTVFLAGVSLFPRLLPCLNDPTLSLTLYNASSTQRTLQAMLIIALVGMPFVIGYTIVIHRIFRGPVKLNEDSY